MARITQIATGNWSAAETWNAGVPLATADVDAGDGYSLVVDEDTAALGSFAFYSSASETLQINNTKTLEVDGDATFDGRIIGTGEIEVSGDCTFTAGMTDLPSTIELEINGTGAQTLTTNGVSIGAVKIDKGSGTVTAAIGSGAAIAASSFLMGNGGSTYVDGGFAHNIAGTIDIYAGSRTGTGTWTMSSSGNLRQSATANAFTKLMIEAGVTATTLAEVYTMALGGAGIITSADPVDRLLQIQVPADNFWSFTGTCSVKVRLRLVASRSSGGAIRVTNQDVVLLAQNTNVLTMDGDLDLGTGDLLITPAEDGFNQIVMGSYALTCGDVLLGVNGQAAKDGKIDLGTGAHSIANANMVAGGGSDGNVIDFGSSHTTLTGTIDGTGIVPENTNGCVSGGTIDDVDLTGKPVLMHIYPVTAGSNNVNVTEVDLPFGYAAGITKLRLMGRVKAQRGTYRVRAR